MKWSTWMGMVLLLLECALPQTQAEIRPNQGLRMRLSRPDFAASATLESQQTWDRGGNLRVTFTFWRADGKVDCPEVFAPIGGWFFDTVPNLNNSTGWSTLSGAEAPFHNEATTAGSLACGTWGRVLKYSEFVGNQGIELPHLLQIAAQQAAQKESAITVRITLGDETGGFLEWSTDWGQTWNEGPDERGRPDRYGQAYHVADLRVGFTCVGGMILDDILVEQHGRVVFEEDWESQRIDAAKWLTYGSLDLVSQPVAKPPPASAGLAGAVQKIATILQPLPPAAVNLQGFLGVRTNLSATKMRRLRDKPIQMEEPETAEEGAVWPGNWGIDYPGRWLEGATLLEAYGYPSYNKSPILEAVLEYQQADGHFSATRDMMTYWGDHRGMIGLAVMAASGNQEALAAAKKLADYYAARVAARDWEAMGVLAPPGGKACPVEGLVTLYRFTKNEDYLATARAIAKHTMFYRQVEGHAHCLMTSLRGLLRLAEVTREAKYLRYVESIWEEIKDAAYISGSFPEGIPDKSGNEACATVDWLRLNLELWRLTQQERYLDCAEPVVFNGLPFDQNRAGGFVAHRDLRGRAGEPADQCCSYHGATGLMHLAQHVYSTAQPHDPEVDEQVQRIYVNFLVPSSAEVSFPGTLPILVEQAGDYPLGTDVSLSLRFPQATNLEVWLRIPNSAREQGLSNFRFAPQALQMERQGNWVVLRSPNSVWSGRHEIQFRCPTPLHVTQQPRRDASSQEAAFWHGPLLLACRDAQVASAGPDTCRVLDLKQPAEKFKLDRAFWHDEPLQIGDKRYAHGLGFNSWGKITISLGANARTFQAELGIGDTAGTRAAKTGRVGFDLMLDDQTVLSEDLHLGDPPLPLEFDLAGVHLLTLRGHLRWPPGPDEGICGEPRILMAGGAELTLSEIIRDLPPLGYPTVAGVTVAQPGNHLRRTKLADAAVPLAYQVTFQNGTRGTLVPLTSSTAGSRGFCVWFDVDD